jgi:hypothetical protein
MSRMESIQKQLSYREDTRTHPERRKERIHLLERCVQQLSTGIDSRDDLLPSVWNRKKNQVTREREVLGHGKELGTKHTRGQRLGGVGKGGEG